MYKKQHSPIFLFFPVLLLVLVRVLTVDAAILSVQSVSSANVGERIAIDVAIDTEGKSINSIESAIIFSQELFSFNGFSASQSSIPVWVEEPKERSIGTVNFSGVVPGGLDRIYDPLRPENKSIPVVRLFFISKKAGTGEFRIGDSQVLQNDGKGTAVSITKINKTISLSSVLGREIDAPLIEDTVPPEPFVINIIERSLFGKSPRLATFFAEDTAGGIERYEVAVGSLGFTETISPFALPYRLFSYNLTVRAYDFSGNVREQQVTVPGEKGYGIGILLLGLLGVVLLIRYQFYRRV